MDYGYPSNQKWRNARYTLSPTPNVQRLTVSGKGHFVRHF